ncbi:MAG TPA: DUF488 domain-containing protein [bacterium]|nr:DUF488 domain-containing protein [bacterium]
MVNKYFTIGFVKKGAETFFKLLKNAGVEKVVDVRLNNVSQLAGFTKKDDLKYFLKEILSVEYVHCPDFAPTKEILDEYKNKKITWSDYEREYLKLLEKRGVSEKYNSSDFNNACFLCSESIPDQCHRRLLVNYLKRKWNDIEIIHL